MGHLRRDQIVASALILRAGAGRLLFNQIAQIRAAKPDAVYTFMVGSQSISFIKQYAQAGLQQQAPLFGIDATSTEMQWPAQGDAALGITVSTSWSADLDNPANQKFVARFRAKYGRGPTIYAAMQYDAVKLIDAAVTKVHGDVSDKPALRAALRGTDFASIRGPFKFNNNQLPIQDFYAFEVVKEPDGSYGYKTIAKAMPDAPDAYHADCKMK